MAIPLGTSETTFREEAFDLARIGLVLDVIFAPTGSPVQDEPFFGIRRSGPEPGLRRDLVLVCDRRFQLVEGICWSTRCEVAVD